MKKKHAISAGLVIVLSLGVIFLRCGKDNGISSRSGNSSASPAHMSVKVSVDPVGALVKSSMISLNKLIFTMTSNTGDTIRDTLTSSTNPAINTTSTSAQTISKGYTLKTLRTWKVVAMIKDARDSVIHKDSATTGLLYAGDTAHVSLTLSSRYTMYEARFLTLPDSISSAVAGTGKQVLHLNRLVLKVDGVTRVDSIANPGPYFSPLLTAILSYDYVTVGSHTIQLLAYGPMYSWNASNPLFSGSAIINVGAGADSTSPLTLSWMGPTTGTGQISAVIGKVGKVTVTGTLPGTVIP